MSEDQSVDRAVEPVIPDEQIRARAHDIWDRHHRPVGYDLQFWFMAERELKAERKASQAGDQVEMS